MSEPVVYRVADSEGWPKAIISSLRLTQQGGHTRIEVWTRGGKAGELMVDIVDAERIAHLLLPIPQRER